MQVNGENIRFLGDIIEEIKEKMPDGYDGDDLDNVQIFRCIEDKRPITSVYGISEGHAHACIDDSADLESFKSLQRMNYHTPVYDWEYVDREDYAVYISAGSQLEDAMEEDEKMLVLLLPAPSGTIPEKEVWDDVAAGEVSKELYGQIVYSASKKAKLYRGWHFKKKDTDLNIRRQGCKDELLYKQYYGYKDDLLDDIEVKEYHYDPEKKILYAYKEIGGYKFHQILFTDVSMERAAASAKESGLHLKVIKDDLWIEGVGKDSDKVFCDEFVRFAYDKLIAKNQER